MRSSCADCSSLRRRRRPSPRSACPRRAAAGAGAGHRAGDSRRPAGRRIALADLRRRLRQPSAQSADADHARERRTGWSRSGRSRPARSATSKRRRSCATTCCTSPVRRTSRGRSTRAPAARSGATAASCRHGPHRLLRPRQPRASAMLGDKLFMTTLDAHLLALDMKTGAVVWDATLEDYKTGYASTIAPLVVKDKVIVGVAGGEYGIRGFIDAYDAQTGKRAWRFYTIPGPGEPGNDTWAGDSWKTRRRRRLGDRRLRPRAEPRCTYGIGNPGPRLPQRQPRGRQPLQRFARRARRRHGNAALALPVHAARRARLGRDRRCRSSPTCTIDGQPRKVVMFANRNGFFYTLDRTNGRVDRRQAVRQTTWAKEIGADGRPVLLPGHMPDEKGAVTCPDLTGGTNFWPPSLRPGARGSSSSTRARSA